MTKYDEVLYPTNTFPQTHPDRLATNATLLGMHPAKVDNCRYLELGCGSGGNLIPMAFNLPGSEFVGIDLAGSQVAAGREFANELGLKNLTLHHMSIEDISEEFGKFDFIVSHGVYSWVPAFVRDKMMEICKTYLNEQGVAYISYNTDPGGHLRRMVREMMLYHVRDIEDPQQKISQARGLLTFLSETGDTKDSYAEFLKNEVERVQKFERAHLFHDDLAEINDPVYFHEFIEHANRFGLKFLAEADFFDMNSDAFPPPVAAKLKELGDDVLRKEQYSDFLRCRRFRQTLLCHEDVSVNRHGLVQEGSKLYVASSLISDPPDRELKSTDTVDFRNLDGARISTDHPILKESFRYLGEQWPQMIHFDDLLSEARLRIGRTDVEAPIQEDAKVLAEALLQAFESNILKFFTYRPTYARTVSDGPGISRLAQAQLRRTKIATNHLHASLKIEDSFALALLTLLDGTRNRDALLVELRSMIEAGRPGAAGRLDDMQIQLGEEGVEGHLDEVLDWLAKNGLLVT